MNSELDKFFPSVISVQWIRCLVLEKCALYLLAVAVY